LRTGQFAGGRGKNRQVFDRYEFNDEIAVLRGLLDDLAKETGGRRNVTESSSMTETYEQRVRRWREERGLASLPERADAGE
jgi:hypothetical protein